MEILNSILHSIGFNWHVALANFINFLIILFILNKFVFKKVFSNIESRQKLIKEGLENASLAESNLKKAAEEAEAIIKDSKKEGEKILKSIIDKAEEEAKLLKQKSDFEAEKIKEKLNLKLSEAFTTANQDFAKIAPDLVVKLLKKTLTNIDDETHNKIIQNLLK